MVNAGTLYLAAGPGDIGVLVVARGAIGRMRLFVAGQKTRAWRSAFV